MRDLISRQAAIDAVGSMLRRKFGIGGDLAEITLAELPSAQPDVPDTYIGDMISRQAAIETVKKHYRGIDNDLLEIIAYEMEELPPAQPGWIPCSKKLPELNRSVLVQLSDDFVDPIQIMTLNISKCEGDFFYFWETQEMGINFEMGDVVAWMPLPKPWEGKEQ